MPRKSRHGVLVLSLCLLAACDAPRPRPRPFHIPAPVPHALPAPAYVSRQAWHADDTHARTPPVYTGPVEIVFVHHTNQPNGYDCVRDVPAILRSIEVHHIDDEGWDDIGYNFAVDHCGTIYEGRAGGATQPVRGAHTRGFNAHSVGIAAIGTFGAGQPVPRPMIEAIAAIAAWKLPENVSPLGTVRLVASSNGGRYAKGATVDLNVISGHRDGDSTDCPGQALYDALPEIRAYAAQLRQDIDRPPR
ncbi:hypothetical protein Sm713_73320 [Streptomyces sp. TS71-3]|nr:hypothetical protein Sm713_73320 [Streptomyces sp. TS71-3]